MTTPIILCIAVLLGAFIGLERESYEHKTNKTKTSGRGSPGIRTFALTSLLGAVGGILVSSNNLFSTIITVAFFLLTITYYIIGTIQTKDAGFTTELAVLFSYILGYVLGHQMLPVQLVIAISVILVLIMSLKDEIRSFVKTIKNFELESLIAYAIIALVIYPFLPNVSYTVGSIPFLSQLLTSFGISVTQIASVEVLNPHSLWRIVMLITGIDVAGYILQRTLGQKKGWILTSVVGGFISSTSTTLSLAIQSKTSKDTNRLTAAALIANTSSFVQHMVLIASLNAVLFSKSLISYLIPLILSGVFIAFVYMRKDEDKNPDNIPGTKRTLKKTKIFSLKPALSFALLFLCVKLTTKLALIFFGSTGFVFSNMLAALSGMDAVTISVSELARKTVPLKTAILTLIGANGINLASKTVYSYLKGSSRFALQFSIGSAVIVLSTLIGYIIL